MLSIEVIADSLSEVLKPYGISVDVKRYASSPVIERVGLREVHCYTDQKVRWLDKVISICNPAFTMENMTDMVIEDTVRMEEKLWELRRIVSFDKVFIYSTNPLTIHIECHEGVKLIYAMLKELSGFFGTEEIDVNAETRNGGYCETCAYEYSVDVINVINPTKNMDIRN